MEKLLDLISDIVDAETPTWREKKEELLRLAKSSERWSTNLDEFVSWFEGEEF
jgi:hypothetical protein